MLDALRPVLSLTIVIPALFLAYVPCSPICGSL